MAAFGNFIFLRRNTEISERNAQLAELRLIRENFSQAIEQMSSEQLVIRLGGIYTLEKIALDSLENYGLTVLDVLLSFVRLKNTLGNKKAKSTVQELIHEQKQNSIIKKISEDTQVSINIIGSLDKQSYSSNRTFSLSKTNLSNSNLSNMDFANFCFDSSVLQSADLSHSVLSKSSFREANIKHSNLYYTNLEEAELYQANLQDSVCMYTNFSKAILQEQILKIQDLEKQISKMPNLEEQILQTLILEGQI